jgi:hypothetical protein
VLDMRRFVIRAAIAVTLLTVLWFFTSRWCSLLVDQFYTERLATLQSSPLGWNGNRLQFGPAVSNILGPTGWTGPDLLNGGHIVDLTGPGPDYKQVAELKVNADDQLMLLKDGKSFVLGSRAGTLPGADDVITAFAAGAGDTSSVTLECSLLSWPTPFELNFMTGYAPSWQRYLYYLLSWRKPSGAQLNIVWRYRQDYDSVNGWTGQMVQESIRVEIRPAPPSRLGP